MMIDSYKYFSQNSNVLEKMLLIMFSLLPITLVFSIFVSDLFASLIAAITIMIIIRDRKFFNFFDTFKWPYILMLSFYAVIILSLLNSLNFGLSFLPSFFYFRFFLMIFGIFYIIKNYQFTLYAILYSILFMFFLIVFDSLIQFNFNKNILGYSLQSYGPYDSSLQFITSFFDKEKKVGSYIIRILPFLISLIILLDLKILNKINIKNIIICLAAIIVVYSSERTSLLMFAVFFLFYLKLIKHKFKILILSIIIFTSFTLMNDKFYHKLVNGTLAQLEIVEQHDDHKKQIKYYSRIQYYSSEHQNLALTALKIFKVKPITGMGVKSFRRACSQVNFKNFVCSTHPHSTYPQILAEIGIFGFLIVAFIFCYIFYLNIKVVFTRTSGKVIKSFYILNVGIIINLMPFIPSGSFFNNWVSLMIFLPLGLWLYLFSEIKKSTIN